jgi:hypothetical protein
MSVWHEIVVVGGEDALRGFLAGFAAARGSHEAVLVGRDVMVHPGSLGERLRALVGAAGHHSLLAPEPTAAALVAALRARGGDAGLHVDSVAAVVSAEFSFSAQAFSPEVASAIEAALHENVPAGVAIEAFKEAEETDGRARGAELYSPSHDYTYRAKGRVAGELTGVLEMRRRAAEIEFVKAEPVELETRPLG